MKKILCLASILVISAALAACGNNNSSTTEIDNNTNKHLNGGAEQLKGESMLDTRIKLTFNNKEVFVKMYDNPTSNDFLAQLPLSITFEDYIGKEKISILQKRLSADDVQAGDLLKKETLLITLLGEM